MLYLPWRFSPPRLSVRADAEEEAHTYLVRGMAAIEMAKSDDELVAAVEEFKIVAIKIEN